MRRFYTVENTRTGTTLLTRAAVADHYFLRLRGLLGRKCPPEGHGMLLVPCKAVHTFGMRYALDICFLTKDNRISKLLYDFQPNRCSPVMKEAVSVLEAPAGTFKGADLRVGDVLALKEQEGL